jgi:hypothetical protein
VRAKHAAIEKHRAARQGRRIDVGLIHDIERVAERGLTETRGHSGNQPRANALDQVFCRSIVQHWQLLARLGRRLSTNLHILRRCETVVP